MRFILLVLVSCPAVLWAAEPREWTVERRGLTFELTSQDLRAWKGPRSGPPVFSIQRLLAEEKARFDKDVAEAIGSPGYSAEWEADLAALARKLHGVRDRDQSKKNFR